MSDYIVRAMAGNAQIRAFAATTREIVETARKAHETSPVVTAALGRLLTGGVIMGSMLKGEDDMLTLQIQGGGAVKTLMVTADSKGNVKGYAGNPSAMAPPNAKGKLDVGGIVAPGFLTVIKDMGLKEPYSSQIELASGEIGDDLTYYFAASEQVPSCVGLGVLMNKDNTVKQAGGFIIQLMPFAADDLIDRLEQKLAEVKSVTELLDEGMTPEQILEQILGDFGLEILDTMPAQFSCNCSRERVEKVLLSLSRRDVQDMIDEGEPVELKCHFCNTAYTFDMEDLKKIQKSRK